MDATGTKQMSLDLFPDEITFPCPLRTQPHGCPVQRVQAGNLQAAGPSPAPFPQPNTSAGHRLVGWLVGRPAGGYQESGQLPGRGGSWSQCPGRPGPHSTIHVYRSLSARTFSEHPAGEGGDKALEPLAGPVCRRGFSLSLT